MHPLAKKHFEKVFKTWKFFADEHCKYYPCHFESQDCTWCFCPLYPCVNLQENIRLNEQEWICSKCHWIHKKEAAKKILEEMKLLGIKNTEELEVERNKIKGINNRVSRTKHTA